VTAPVWAWGSNYYGESGDGTTIPRTLPVQVIGLTNVRFISAGAEDSAAILSNGTIATWGANIYGQIGNGAAARNPQPVFVSGVSGAVVVGAGSDTAAVTNQGTVFAWGLNSNGRLGNGTTNNASSPGTVDGVGSSWLAAKQCRNELPLRCGRQINSLTDARANATTFSFDLGDRLSSVTTSNGLAIQGT